MGGDQVSKDELVSGLLFPPQSDIVQVEVATAIKVCDVIFDRGLAGVERPSDVRAFVEPSCTRPNTAPRPDHGHDQRAGHCLWPPAVTRIALVTPEIPSNAKTASNAALL